MYRLYAILVALVLSVTGCTYTFLPLVPPVPAFPNLESVFGELENQKGQVLARLDVRRISRPGYLELRWYNEEKLILERSIWIEGPGKYETILPKGAISEDQDEFEMYYRLSVLWQDSLVLQLDLGTPGLPSAPATETDSSDTNTEQ